MSDTSSFQLINVGAVPNDGTGDDIRDAFIKINSNFSNIVAIGENVGNLKVAGFANIAGNINLSGYLNVVGNVNYSSSNVTTFQTFSVIGTTDSTTPTNGALVVAGGAGVVKNLHVGGTVTAAGFYGTISTTNQPSINQLGTLVSLNVGGSTTFHNVVYANTAMNSSNVYTGAMVIAGGIGLTGNLNLTGGIGAGGTLGQNGQFLVSSGMGIAWSNAPITSTLIYGATNVVASTNFANIGVNGTNIASFSNTSLTISGNISANYFTGNGALLTGISTYGNTSVAAYLPIYSGSIGGSLTTAAQTAITSVGTLTSLAVTGTATAATVNAINLGGTLASSAQPNITSVGTLTSLGVSGAITVNSGNGVSAIINGGTAGIGNIGALGAGFNTVYAKATSAVYADLAENYVSDSSYEAGTVLEFGGEYEVTISDTESDRVAGIVSTNPAYLMNVDLDGDYIVALALQGRVPCKVIGNIKKGDMLTSAGNGYAMKSDNKVFGSIIGKALQDFTGGVGVIEVVVGRL